jgi:hypothetical protein
MQMKKNVLEFDKNDFIISECMTFLVLILLNFHKFVSELNKIDHEVKINISLNLQTQIIHLFSSRSHKFVGF